MAKKVKTVYICSECGNEFPAWQGQCNFCGSWNTISELKIKPDSSNARRKNASDINPSRLIDVGTSHYSRIDTGIGELDRVLGGGLVKGSLILISGEPGIGKSTMILQAANAISKKYGKVLYVSGEESEEQVKLRADRVSDGISRELYIFSETNMENIMSNCEEIKPVFLVIDSIQTMFSDFVDSTAGSITQIRSCTDIFMKFAKTSGTPVFIVAHVNKSGDLAGPKTIEHMVDCVLNFTGERDGELRILRSFKNRFGTTDEIGAFKMTSFGMEEVKDLSGSLVSEAEINEEGSVISAVYEGSRPVFFEIQALVAPANVGFARRTSVGIDNNRLNMILAVLEKKAGISLINHDVYLNVAGGVRPDSTSTDIAVALAIYSSYSGKTSPQKVVAVGEIGLTGALRSVRGADKIIAEAKRLGYDAVILPLSSSGKAEQDISGGIKLIKAGNIREAIRAYIGKVN